MRQIVDKLQNGGYMYPGMCFEQDMKIPNSSLNFTLVVNLMGTGVIQISQARENSMRETRLHVVCDDPECPFCKKPVEQQTNMAMLKTLVDHNMTGPPS